MKTPWDERRFGRGQVSNAAITIYADSVGTAIISTTYSTVMLIHRQNKQNPRCKSQLTADSTYIKCVQGECIVQCKEPNYGHAILYPL